MNRNHCKVALLLTLIIALISPAYAKGKKIEYIPLGPTGILGTFEKKQVLVDGTEPGSPADGKLKKGDVISGMGADFVQAILAAEASDGKLTLQLKDGKKVTLQLKALGGFSPTAPYNCPKTNKLITLAADGLAKEFSGKGDKNKGLGSSATNAGLLGLMATGEQKYTDVAFAMIKNFESIGYNGKSLQTRKLEQTKETGKYAGRVGSWSAAYDTILLAEYFYLTKDSALLPTLKTYTLSLVEGQDAAGLYGHKMADPATNRAPGYGQMNNVSLACLMGMQLSKKCGVDVPGLDEAIGRTVAYVEYHIGRGGFAYGFHGPRNFYFNNNGTSGLASICMTLAGNKEGAKFFSAMSATSGNKLGTGHASSLFSTYWTPAGANVAGPKVTQKLYPEVQEYLTLRRRWDGSHLQGYNEGRIGGVALLAYCLPRKALLITGRDADETLWLNDKEADAAFNMRNLTTGKNPEELMSFFGHENPVVRHNAVEAIAVMVGMDAKSLQMASKGKKDSKKAQARASQKKAWEKLVATLFPKLQQMISSGTPHEKASALQCYLFVCPEGDLQKRLQTIGTILRNTKEADTVRVEAATALASHPESIQPYFDDILKFLLEERPSDRFAEVDAQIAAKALNPISKSVEWNPYKAGLVKDKDLFYRSANRLMEHKRQSTRGTGVRMVANVPFEALPVVIDDLDHILKDDDKTYHTYHNARHAKEPAAGIYVKHNILEGVDYIVDTILGGEGKTSFKLRVLIKTLPGYGIHAQRVVPKVKENMWVKMAINPEGKNRFYAPLMEMFKTIENATTGPKLIPVEEIKKMKAKK